MLTKICTTALAWIGAGLFVWFVLWITVIGEAATLAAMAGKKVRFWQWIELSVFIVLLWPVALAVVAWEFVSPAIWRGRR